MVLGLEQSRSVHFSTLQFVITLCNIFWGEELNNPDILACGTIGVFKDIKLFNILNLVFLAMWFRFLFIGVHAHCSSLWEYSNYVNVGMLQFNFLEWYFLFVEYWFQSLQLANLELYLICFKQRDLFFIFLVCAGDNGMLY